MHSCSSVGGHRFDRAFQIFWTCVTASGREVFRTVYQHLVGEGDEKSQQFARHSRRTCLFGRHAATDALDGQTRSSRRSRRFFDVVRAMLFHIDEFPERLRHPKESNLLFPSLVKASAQVMGAIGLMLTRAPSPIGLG